MSVIGLKESILKFWFPPSLPPSLPPIQQEVIVALMTHVGSGMATEIDHALDVLGALVESHPSVMDRFAVLVKVGLGLTILMF